MKTTIVCGVLGSGKTTYLRNILKHSTEKTVVLVNDFGSAGIDGEILSSGGIETIEMPSGCVCCTLRFDLITSIEKIVKELRPAHLYIEPSGVASPSGVIDVLDTLKLQPVTVVGIIDATEFIDAYESEMYGWFFKSQVTWSDIILVNKTDLADENKVAKTVLLIEKLNQNAVIIPTVNAELNEELLLDNVNTTQKPDVHGHELRFETLSVHLDKTADIDHISRFFEMLAGGACGNVVRAKGLVQTDRGPYRFDLASKQVAAVPFGREIKDSRIVVIGTELQDDKIRKETA
jgi:G3E family GTPase